jgi:hypothetical protein
MTDHFPSAEEFFQQGEFEKAIAVFLKICWEGAVYGY